MVAHGDLARQFDVAGCTVAAVRSALREAFSIPDTATPYIDGRPVAEDYLLPAGVTLEFLRRHGRKGVGRVWTPDEFCDLFRCSRADLNRQVNEGLQVLPLEGGDFRVTETAVDDFLRGKTAASADLAGGGNQPSALTPWLSGPNCQGGDRPCWNPHARELRVGCRLIKRFRQPADCQEAVLGEFELHGWPGRIDNPLPPDPQVDRKRQRRDTVESLNRNHAAPGVLRFESDGNGGIRWRMVAPGS